MNQLGLGLSRVGNHEFDEGDKELQRCSTAAAGDATALRPGRAVQGCDVQVPGRQRDDNRTHLPMFPPVWIKQMGGATIGFIGLGLESTPDIVTEAGVAGLTFKKEVGDRQLLRQAAQPVRSEGDRADGARRRRAGKLRYNYDCNAGGLGTGMNGDRQHRQGDRSKGRRDRQRPHAQSYVCNIPDPAGQPRMVTSASSFGRLYTEINFNYDKKTRDIVRPSVTAVNHIVSHDNVVPDAAETALVSKYNTLIAPVGEPVGSATSRRTSSAAGPTTPEEPLGDLLADAQLADQRRPPVVQTIAVTNPGGIRSDLTDAASGARDG